ncbi:hypothetical protein BDV19DRAFT_391389 [Aspergillus venezuelensis]
MASKLMQALPTEILFIITESLPIQDRPSLALVCRRFAAIVQPQIYRAVRFNMFSTTPKHLQSLEFTLYSRPSLFTYCRELSVIFDNSDTYMDASESDSSVSSKPSLDHCMLLRNLIRVLPNVQSLTLRGSYDEHSPLVWGLTRYAVQHMHRLKDLELNAELGWFYLQDLDATLHGLQSLDTLVVRCLCFDDYRRDMDELMPENNTEVLAEVVPSIGTGMNSDEMSFDSHEFVPWPNSVAHLRLDCWINRSRFVEPDIIVARLRHYKRTLVSLDLRIMGHCDLQGIIDTSDFPELETARLPIPNLRRPNNPVWPVDMTLGPKLHTITLDFSADNHYQYLENFDEAEEKWITKLARGAVADKKALREIKIAFRNDVREWRRGNCQQLWDRLDRLGATLNQLGLRLSYKKRAPSVD